MIGIIKEEKFDPCCVLRVDAEICPVRIESYAERRTSSFLSLLCHWVKRVSGVFAASQAAAPAIKSIRIVLVAD